MNDASLLQTMQTKTACFLSRASRSLPLCFLAGGLSALAMAPLNAAWVLLFTLPTLYLSLHFSKSGLSVFAAGWLFGFGYFVFGLYWIGNALLVEGNAYKWAWPLAVCGLPALLAFFTAAGTWLLRRIAELDHISGWLAFAAILTLFEWLRGHLFTGFPWNLFGYTWSDTLPILQILHLSDVYGLTLLTLLWFSIPGFILLAPQKRGQVVLILGLASFAACYTYGLSWLKTHPLTYHENLTIRIVQPNIDQAEKWNSDAMNRHFDKHLNLSRNAAEVQNPGDQNKTSHYIIWPETALSYRYVNDPSAMAALREMLNSYPGPTYLFTGLLSYDPQTRGYKNALVMIDQNGTLSNTYTKHHLVPFGEYIPFQNWIPLEPVARFNGFQKGAGPQSFATPQNLHYSPLICYEIIFPGKTIPKNGPAPDFILNVTNDAWYGISPGPYQHFVQAQFRAVESGIPVIRAANTGFSGILAPNGEKIGTSRLYTENTSDLHLPQSYPISVWGINHRSLPLLILIAAISALALGQKMRAKPHKKP
ncbi:MAG: apolipoprotein N-acyltransferase [Alphaproteobacteria bacterium]|nr:apolipoprotein N-acyltransferase [Alphaproteobacteria bacterium]